MNRPVEHAVAKALDSVQARLASYASDLDYDSLPAEAIHAAKVRIIDTLGSLMGGFFGEPCQMGRNIAARAADPAGATVIGTRIKAAPDMAAFANATAARYVEMNDVYHWPGSSGGHPSDVLMPILAVAEQARTSGRDFIAGVVLGYEIYLRLSDAITHSGFDCANFACLGVTAASGKLMGLSSDQIWPPCPAIFSSRSGPDTCPCGRRWPPGRPGEQAFLPPSWRVRGWKAHICLLKVSMAGAIMFPGCQLHWPRWVVGERLSRSGTS